MLLAYLELERLTQSIGCFRNMAEAFDPFGDLEPLAEIYMRTVARLLA